MHSQYASVLVTSYHYYQHSVVFQLWRASQRPMGSFRVTGWCGMQKSVLVYFDNGSDADNSPIYQLRSLSFSTLGLVSFVATQSNDPRSTVVNRSHLSSVLWTSEMRKVFINNDRKYYIFNIILFLFEICLNDFTKFI